MEGYWQPSSRVFINDVGNQNVLVIRRLRCRHCHRIHHELPDILVPYKRHSSESIESVNWLRTKLFLDSKG
ncbi:MAG: DUF6431 domain-containing protein [Bacillota bacterium]